MKKTTRLLFAGLAMVALILPVTGCRSGENPALTQESEIATVQRGDMTIDITSVGNLALSQTEDLAFEMAGTVEEVLVNEGDSVTEGQELVKLDTSEWSDLVKTRERALTTAQRALTTAERLIGTKELAVRQEELDLETAEYNLNQIDEVKEAQDAIDRVEYLLKYIKSRGLEQGELTADYLQRIDDLEAELAQAQQKKQDILSGSVSLTTSVAIQVANYQLQVEKAQRDLEEARIALENTRLDKENAEEDAEDAQSALDDANALSPIITALFDGFITRVNVEGGDEVLKGTVAVQLADPAEFEADILVGEMDILQVQLGGTAWVEVDALSGLSLPAEVTHISPTATIQAGVVNYTVKVEIQSLEGVAQERQQTRQEMMGDISSGEMPERMKQAIEEGVMTQEQAEDFMKRMQSGELPFAPGGGAGQGQLSPDTGGGQIPTMVPDNYQLREGLTVTVNLIVDSRTNVLLVPNAAITIQGQQSFVHVVSEDETIEERSIEVGITDYQFTEVTGGLSEGEEIIVPQGTSTTTSTQQNQPGGLMIPGMGRPR
ncbi:efflux RND transporter periplasmic adaptor subunit [Chloroflexota bacterium]